MKPVIKVNDRPVLNSSCLFFMAMDSRSDAYVHHAELPSSLEDKESMLDILNLTVKKLERQISQAQRNNNPGLNIYLNQVGG